MGALPSPVGWAEGWRPFGPEGGSVAKGDSFLAVCERFRDGDASTRAGVEVITGRYRGCRHYAPHAPANCFDRCAVWGWDWGIAYPGRWHGMSEGGPFGLREGNEDAEDCSDHR